MVRDDEWRAVLLSGDEPAALTDVLLARRPATVSDALQTGVELAALGARPGRGESCDLWSALATVAAHDLQSARAMEPQLDAAAILGEAAESGQRVGGAGELGRTWGVFAAEGADPPLTAKRGPNGWTLSGVKPWCSLAATVDAALITAWVGDERRLFAVRLRQTGVVVDVGSWHARGLVDIPSGSVTFSEVDAVPVGELGWYLERPGFDWGGIGVAACWYGGAVGIARSVLKQARDRAASTTIDIHLGAMDELLTASRVALRDAANSIDSGSVEDPALLAKRVRGLVARTCEEVLWRAGHALGPAPLATDAEHAQRVADLQLYLRQHHAERDQESLGRAVRTLTSEPW
ncbi:MAG: acyl-CoA/acyl-ACP dehydrogenase [Actinomycetota bacterium]|nr:acyl-CoA/acyl-ACP dehydrogenase [Actinomycetota bacterium]